MESSSNKTTESTQRSRSKRKRADESMHAFPINPFFTNLRNWVNERMLGCDHKFIDEFIRRLKRLGFDYSQLLHLTDQDLKEILDELYEKYEIYFIRGLI